MTRRRSTVLALLAAGGVAALAVARLRSTPPPPSPAGLAALQAERDTLQDALSAAVVARGERSLGQAPRAGLMIGVPTTFTRSILEQLVTGIFAETTLTLRNLEVHQTGEVKAKLLFARRTVGRYGLDVRIRQVRGILKPGKPTLSFGENDVGVRLPVRLTKGEGDADLRFVWDSKGVAANLVCGDVDVTRHITGGVIPRDYEIGGKFAIAAEGESLVLRPQFPNLAVRIVVDPSEEAWSVVDGVIRNRPKGCEIALGKVDVKEKLSGLLGRGFNVKIPQKIFKPISMPAGFRQSLELQGISLLLRVKPTGLLVAGDRLWYGANVEVTRRKPR